MHAKVRRPSPPVVDSLLYPVQRLLCVAERDVNHRELNGRHIVGLSLLLELGRDLFGVRYVARARERVRISGLARLKEGVGVLRAPAEDRSVVASFWASAPRSASGIACE